MEDPLSFDICRACLKTNAFLDYQFYINVSPELYYFCTSIKVQEEDTLPKSLCESCHDSLVKYCNFKTKCLNSQSKLLDNYNVKPECNINTGDLTNFDTNAQLSIQNAPDHELLKSEPIEEENMPLSDNDTLPGALDLDMVTTKKRRLSKIKAVGKLFACKLCKKTFKHKEVFEAHSLEHEGKTVNISCATCNKAFTAWSSLRRHNESEHAIVKLKSLKCTFCGKILKNRHSLKMHKTLHDSKKKVKVNICNVCGKGLSSYVNLQNHLETHTERRERKYACEHCGKKFFTHRTLKLHLSRTHASTKKFICHICDFAFTQKYNLSIHLLSTHEGKKAFKCEICSKTFSRQLSLMEHKRSHSGEKPFRCEYCLKSFATRRCLIDHKKIHTGEKPHKCEVCNQCFTQRGTLVRHMKIHK